MTTSESALDLLVLGGTSWLGGVTARTATARGHRVTCLARGVSGEAPDGVTWVRADRTSDRAYDEVTGRAWDAVIEVSWQPDFVRAALGRLTATARHWVYVSSTSVYADDSTAYAAEDAPLHAPHQGAGPVDFDVYGSAKVACEQACVDILGPDRVLLARAGLIGGYGDRSDRLGYWPARLARATPDEAVLVPPRDSPAQVVDVEDLAAWLVLGAEERIAGVFNATGDVTTTGAVLAACPVPAGRGPRCVPATDEWLQSQGVEPWMGPDSLPLWLPRPEYAGFATRLNTAARAAGLRLRPLEDTLRDALRWEQERGLDRDRSAGLSPAREQELLARLTGDSAVVSST